MTKNKINTAARPSIIYTNSLYPAVENDDDSSHKIAVKEKNSTRR